MDPALIVFGLGVGVLVGTTGMGGGSLMTPLLILVFGVKPVVAVGTDLAYAALTKTLGGYRHLRKGTVHLGLSAWLAIGSVPGALVGVYVLDVLRDWYGHGFDDFLIVLIASALLLTGLLVLARALVLRAQGDRADIRLATRHKLAAIALGVSVGFVLGITSAGSGTLIAVGLILGFRLTPLRVVGTDVFHAAVLLWAAAGAHVVSGNVDFALAGTILIGSLPGVWIGTGLAARLPESGLRPALGIVLLASGLGLLTKAGVDVPAAVLVGVPIALVLASWLVHSIRTPTGVPQAATDGEAVAEWSPEAGPQVISQRT